MVTSFVSTARMLGAALLCIMVVSLYRIRHPRSLVSRTTVPSTPEGMTTTPFVATGLRGSSLAAQGLAGPNRLTEATDNGHDNSPTRSVAALPAALPESHDSLPINERKLTMDEATLSTKASENTTGTSGEMMSPVKSPNSTVSTSINVPSVAGQANNSTTESTTNETGSQAEPSPKKGFMSGLFAVGAFLCAMCLLMSSSGRVHDNEYYPKNKDDRNASGHTSTSIIPAATSSESGDFAGDDVTVCRQNSAVPAAEVK